MSPAAADPPEQFEAPWGYVWLDVEHGYWIFINVDREFLCGDGESGFIGLLTGQMVMTSDALVIRSEMLDAPTWLHSIEGDLDDPDFGICGNSAVSPALVGTTDLRHSENDSYNEGKRANSFGDHAQGIVYDVDDGTRYRLRVTFRAVAPPDENGLYFDPAWIKVESVGLHPTGPR